MAAGEECANVRSARREAIIVLSVWLIAGVWSIGYSYHLGYSDHPRSAGDVSSLVPAGISSDRSASDLTTPGNLGIPDWVLWGVVVPWGIGIIFSCWFALVWMADDAESADKVTP